MAYSSYLTEEILPEKYFMKRRLNRILERRRKKAAYNLDGDKTTTIPPELSEWMQSYTNAFPVYSGQDKVVYNPTRLVSPIKINDDSGRYVAQTLEKDWDADTFYGGTKNNVTISAQRPDFMKGWSRQQIENYSNGQAYVSSLMDRAANSGLGKLATGVMIGAATAPAIALGGSTAWKLLNNPIVDTALTTHGAITAKDNIYNGLQEIKNGNKAKGYWDLGMTGLDMFGAGKLLHDVYKFSKPFRTYRSEQNFNDALTSTFVDYLAENEIGIKKPDLQAGEYLNRHKRRVDRIRQERGNIPNDNEIIRYKYESGQKGDETLRTLAEDIYRESLNMGETPDGAMKNVNHWIDYIKKNGGGLSLNYYGKKGKSIDEILQDSRNLGKRMILLNGDILSKESPLTIKKFDKPTLYDMIESHELDHAVNFKPKESLPDGTWKSPINNQELIEYMTDINNSEIAARGSQLKDYFNTNKLNPLQLIYAKNHYVKDLGLDNNMTEFFDGIKNYRKMANWLTKNATAINPLIPSSVIGGYSFKNIFEQNNQ